MIFNQTSHSMEFCMCNKKWQWLKLRLSIWHFYWCLLYIFSILNTILIIRPFVITSLFPVFSMINQYICKCWIWKIFLNTLSIMMYVLLIAVCMTIYEFLVSAPGSCTFAINIVRILLLVEFKPYTTCFLCPGAPTTQ